MWTETPKLASGKKGRPINKDRFISKMCVSQPIPLITHSRTCGRRLTNHTQDAARRFRRLGAVELKVLLTIS